MKRRVYLILLLGCWCLWGYAQNEEEQYRNIYEQAEADYNIGRLEQAEQVLMAHVHSFSGSMRQSAWRLLALCNLGLDDTETAEQHVRQLLADNPYYSTTANDPQRFIDLVELIKSGLTATITTASSQAESLYEVPVPTTLITEEMIKNCGGRNLQEVLASYVPSMTIVDCNDDINIAMRGIYSNGQEKMLIMVNGHRLNSYCTNIAAPDFSMSLDKIKQIEVLRGPASSLYGGVALTAVVNIITKQGADIDGMKVHAGAGSYGTLRGDFQFGKRFFDLDLFLWGSFYKADGQKFHIDEESTEYMDFPAGDITVGGVGSKPSYDVGINIKWKNLQFLYNTRFSQIISPLTISYMASPYTIDKYNTYNGIKPSFSTESHHADVSYSQQLGKLSLKGAVTYDNADMTHYQVISDQPVPLLFFILELPESYILQLEGKDGLSRFINGQEQTLGFQMKGDYSYINTKSHKGLFSFGAEMNHFRLEDTRYVIGHSFTDRIPETNKVAEAGKGHENSYNAFVQLKHQWNHFILNAGVRYDYKKRYNGSRINEYSPRLALIYLRNKWNVKLSYSKAFIDAPYLYRKTNDYLTIMTGKQRAYLSPESLHSFQMSFAGTQWVKGLDFEINGFYNRARDLIYMQIIDHSNTGNIDTYGLELAGKYTYKTLNANLSLSWQKIRKGDVFKQNISKQFNIPSVSANLVLGWQPTQRLKLNTHLTYSSRQTSYNIDLVNAMLQQIINASDDEETKARLIALFGKDLKNVNGAAINYEDVSPRLLVDVGAHYKIGKSLVIGVNVKNLFNKEYYQSGMATNLIRQQGRWIIGDISYKF